MRVELSKMFRINFLAALQLLLCFAVSDSAAADDWLCRTQAAQRVGTTIVACGIGEADSEAKAREAAFDNAQREFHAICDDSDDCKGHSVVLSPLRNECEPESSVKVKCFRALKF